MKEALISESAKGTISKDIAVVRSLFGAEK
jgi:hypothetical protein